MGTSVLSASRSQCGPGNQYISSLFSPLLLCLQDRVTVYAQVIQYARDAKGNPSLYEPHRSSNRSTKEYGLPAKSENMKIRIMKPDEMENSRTRGKAPEVRSINTQVQGIPQGQLHVSKLESLGTHGDPFEPRRENRTAHRLPSPPLGQDPCL